MDIKQIISVNIRDMAKTWLKFNQIRQNYAGDNINDHKKQIKKENNKKSFTNIEQLFAAV